MQLPITELVIEKRLVAWSESHESRDSQRKFLFGELQKKRPYHGTKRWWRDLVSSDMVELGVKQKWYECCQDQETGRKPRKEPMCS